MTWLYVPPIALSSESPPSAPAAEGSTSGSTSPFTQTSEPWLLSRGKPTPPHVLSRAWKRDAWLRRLSGLTSERSTLDRGVEQWISWWVGTPASPSPLPDSDAEPTIRDTSGLTSCASPRSAVPGDSAARTWAVICDAASTTSSETWTAQVSAWRSSWRKLRTSARRTSASGSSSWPFAWPTSTVADSRSSARGTTTTGVMHTGTMLTDAIRQWPTPTASSATRGTDPGHARHLPTEAKSWPTPTASEATRPATPVEFLRKTPRLSAEVLVPETWMAPMLDGAPAYPTPTASRAGSSQNAGGVPHERPTKATPSLPLAASRGLPPSLRDRPTSPGGAPTSLDSPSQRLRLNVAFVELLMGWPTGWTIPHETTETADVQALYHVDRLRLLGNGVVPQQAAFALRHLVAAMEEAWER